MGRVGAGACTMRSQRVQLSLGRTCRITLNCAGTNSQKLGDVLAQFAQATAAVRARLLFGLVRLRFARRMFG